VIESNRCVSLVLLLLAACTSKSPDGPISIGGTGGGGAAGSGAPGATSESAGGAGASGSGMNTTQPAPIDSVDPLPPSAFPFFRLRYVQSIGDWRVQIWAYDRESKTEKLISALDDAVKAGQMSGPPKLSPDHKWVLIAAPFRAPKETYKPGMKLIWKVRVDGRDFVQITPLPPDPRLPCSNSSQCTGLAERTCENSRCTPFNWKYGYESPVWSPDGRSVLLHLVEYYCLQQGCRMDLTPGAFAWSATGSIALSILDQRGTEPLTLPSTLASECSTGDPSFSSDGKRLAQLYVCGSESGLHLSNPDGTNAQKLPLGLLAQFTWDPLGYAAYYKASSGKQVIWHDFTDGERVVVLDTQPDDPLEAGRFLISDDGKWMFLHQKNLGTKKEDLYLVDLTAGEMKQITTDGLSAL
jgi:hypothetical protein